MTNLSKRLKRKLDSSIRDPWGVFLIYSAFLLTLGLATALFALFYDNQLLQLLGTTIALISLTVAIIVALLQTTALRNITKWVQSVTFNDVTLQIFFQIQKQDKLSRRMREGEVEIKQNLGRVLQSITLDLSDSSGDGYTRSNVFEEFVVKPNIFIESGSTYAYLALELRNYLEEHRSNSPDRKTVFTNNILAFMALVFQDRCRVWLYPGTPSGKYGATYGQDYVPPDNGRIANGDPNYLRINPAELRHFLEGHTIPSLDTNVLDEPDVDTTGSHAMELALMAISRLHLREGPHVGSKENASFKIELLNYCRAKKKPVVILVDWSKIEEEDQPFDEKGCERIYPNGEGFREFLQDIGIGHVFLFVGFEGRKPSRVVALEDRVRSLNTNLDYSVSCQIVADYPNSLLALYADSDANIGKLGQSIRSSLSTGVKKRQAVS